MSIEAAPLKSRKGTPRNTDSFLKDESAEPRRITLTPNLLRDDNSSGSSLEKTRSTSFESFEKPATPPEKPKDSEKKKKEKKPGMLSGFFKGKKKDKKGKPVGDGDSINDEKVSGEISRTASALSSPSLERNSTDTKDSARGKLHKTPPPLSTADVKSNATIIHLRQETPQQRPVPPPMDFVAELEGSQVAYEAPTGTEDEIGDAQSAQSARPPELHQSPSISALTTITNMIRPTSDGPPRQKVKKAKTRVELDDFDSVTEEEEFEEEERRMQQKILSQNQVKGANGTFMHGTEVVHIPTVLDEDSSSSSGKGENTPEERPSEEEERTGTVNNTTTTDQSEYYASRSFGNDTETDLTDDDPTPVPSKPQSPRTSGLGLLQHIPGLPNLQQTPTPPPARVAPFPPPKPHIQTHYPEIEEPIITSNGVHRGDSLSSISTRPSPSPSPISEAGGSATSKETAASWSDATLRAWLEGGEGNDVRDMLVVIHDKSDVVPVAADHPLMAGFLSQEKEACGRMMGELDGLLGGWLKRKNSQSGRPIGTGANVGSNVSEAPSVGAF